MKKFKQPHHAFCITCLNKKELIAQIIKEDLEPFKESSVEEIMNLIESDIQTNIAYPSDNELLDTENDYLKFIALSSDVFFTAQLPHCSEKLNIAINIDCEKDPELFHKRAEDYVHDVLIHYLQHRLDHPNEKVTKFTSIWISLYPDSSIHYPMYSYRINLGSACEDENSIHLEKSEFDSDFFNFERICLIDSEHMPPIYRALRILFNPNQKYRYQLIEALYDIKYDENERIEFENEEELGDLFETSQRIVEQIEKKLFPIRIHYIKQIMKNLNFSQIEAMDALGIKEDEREELNPFFNDKTSE